ncbi:MAG: SpoIIE family protein phosphatase [Acidimicrobiia bacterium]|nr:SpoIIE family protein phosphatase [Acidimicrobiia bacterium]
MTVPQPPEADVTGAVDIGPADILVVDDRPENLVALEAIVEPLGVRVRTALSGDAALRALLHEDFALILLDVQMPGLDGFTTATMIKQHPRTADIPIIFLTAFDEHVDQAAQGYTSGAVDYIVKPFDPWVLRSKVQVFLDLHRKTRQLERQTAQLSVHVEQLRASRAALADAQRMAQLGGWEVDVLADRITGSDQLHRIFGWPLDEPLPRATTLFAQLRLPRSGDRAALLAVQHRLSLEGQLVRPDGEVREVVVNAERHGDDDPARPRVVGTVQDVTEQRLARRALWETTRELEHERELVHLLQASMAPGSLPDIAELDVAACYRPAGSGLAGGDWYDVIPLAGGEVLFVIGDVAGHGVPAASTMSQVRTALRAIVLHETAPGAVVRDLHRYLTSSVPGAFVTVMVARLDPATGRCRLASAGHPPAISLFEGRAVVEWMPAGPPLGTGSGGRYEEAALELPPGGSMVLYTDGLVERRGELIDDGLARLAGCTEEPTDGSWDLVEQITSALCDEDGATDDIALLVVRRREMAAALDLTCPATVDQLSPIRLGVKRWLSANGIAQEDLADLVLAVGELVTNACIHAYPPLSPGEVRLHGELDGEVVRLEICDDGRWSTHTSEDGGRGLALIRALGIELSVEAGHDGTTAVVTTRAARDQAWTAAKGA